MKKRRRFFRETTTKPVNMVSNAKIFVSNAVLYYQVMMVVINNKERGSSIH